MRCSWILSVLSVLLLTGTGRSEEWNLQIADNRGDSGYQSRMVVSSDDTPFIFYVVEPGDDGYLAWWVATSDSGGGWSYESVGDVSPSGSLGMAIDATDRIHLSWSRYQYGSCSSRYGVFDATSKTWIISPTGFYSTGYYVYNTDLALTTIESQVAPVIACQFAHHLRVFIRHPVTGTWSSESVDNTFPKSAPSIAVDSLGAIHLTYQDVAGGNLMYAHNATVTGEWANQIVDMEGEVGEYNSLVMDQNDVPHIVYYDATNGDLKYATLVEP